MTNPAAPEPTAGPEPAERRWVAPTVIGSITAIIIGASLVGTLTGPAPEEAVKDACQSAVTARLKAPSTATFADGQIATDDGEGNWTVRGRVDAQNSFGAMLRTYYTCTVEYRDKDDVQVVDVSTG